MGDANCVALCRELCYTVPVVVVVPGPVVPVPVVVVVVVVVARGVDAVGIACTMWHTICLRCSKVAPIIRDG